MKARREPPSAERMIEVLREDLWSAPQFALFSNVRSATGADVPGLRIADLVAADTRPGPRLVLHGGEIKRFAHDLDKDLEDETKAEEIGQYCETFTLIVPAPAKSVIGKRTLPRPWGVIEIDGNRAFRIVYPEARRPEPAPDGFLRSLLRSAAVHVERELSGEGDAPLRRIVGRVSRDLVVLGPCFHTLLRPLTKGAPPTVPCHACAAGHPAEPDAVAHVLEVSALPELERYREVIEGRLRRSSGPGVASCTPAPELAAAAAGGAHG